MPIRVLRILEYTYADMTTAEEDMARWMLHSPPQSNIKIRTVHFDLQEVPWNEPTPIADEPETVTDDSKVYDTCKCGRAIYKWAGTKTWMHVTPTPEEGYTAYCFDDAEDARRATPESATEWRHV